jgi:hypothetical protein
MFIATTLLKILSVVRSEKLAPDNGRICEERAGYKHLVTYGTKKRQAPAYNPNQLVP